ncbi:hypothetical protein IE4872_PD01679 (plasmid) [Rhizobium gallicum]|uniref:Uncharacterized protein n=1 Tax=Rhizobium gallicum TaxID=56730 RepID=A0A1L5NWC2_9HYPH|nr:hypothetical protein IE4872_PD01679 [Rhizobium gallicum]
MSPSSGTGFPGKTFTVLVPRSSGRVKLSWDPHSAGKAFTTDEITRTQDKAA